MQETEYKAASQRVALAQIAAWQRECRRIWPKPKDAVKIEYTDDGSVFVYFSGAYPLEYKNAVPRFS